MLALTVVFAASLYLVGLRADRIHAGRAVTQPGVTKGSTEPRHTSGSVTAQRSDGIAAVTAKGSVSSVSAHSVSRPVPVRYAGLTASEWAAKYRQMRRIAYARLPDRLSTVAA